MKQELVHDLIGDSYKSVSRDFVHVDLLDSLMGDAELMDRTALSPNGIVRKNLLFTVNTLATKWVLDPANQLNGKRMADQLRDDTVMYVFQQKHIQGLRQQARLPNETLTDPRPLNVSSSARQMPPSRAQS